ncbi:hypothetical protein QJQ45_001726 [Haematococcus lacustris]|nr:hypothetical protein QJQ45_001726 [Haematococcus lacustris]
MAKKGSGKHKKDPGKKQKASRSRQGKLRQERRDGWTTRRRQVIKIPEGAVLRGCKKTRRKLREHLRLRAEIHSQLRFIASLFVLRTVLTCLGALPAKGKEYPGLGYKRLRDKPPKAQQQQQQPAEAQ